MSGQTQFLTRAGSNLDRLTPSVWRSWAPSFARKVKPSAIIAVRDALNDEIARLTELGKLGTSDD